MRIEGKVAVVVGAARGIGKAYCRALLQNRAKAVVVADVLVTEGEATVGEFQTEFGDKASVTFVKCDNTSDEDVQGLFREAVGRFGRPDIVIHNAGIVHEFEWQRCLDINIGGCVRTTNEALKHMSKDNGGKGGVMVHTASIGSLTPSAWGPVYIATKYAVLGYTLSWALPDNLEKTGVRFNCVCPTTVDTVLPTMVRPGRTLNSEHLQAEIAKLDKVSPDFVAEGMIKLIEDDSLNGKALRVSKALGHDFAPFPEQPVQ